MMAKESMKSDTAQDKAMIKKAFKQHDMQEHKGGKGTTLKLKKGGHVESKREEMGEHGHTPMSKGNSLMVAIAVGKGKKGAPDGDSPKKPSMSDRRKAMAAPFMKKGGKAKKDGLAVMIALGGPKKGMMDGGEIPTDMRASKLAQGGMACAEGGMMKPVKKAAGGAGKVRKGMMTPEGQITHAMNKLRGK
jgi:hypothetical protein